jgi:SAM-dependent methyltransferase
MAVNRSNKSIFQILRKPLLVVRKTIYKGEKVRCNICGNNFSRFLSHKLPYRRNARCPYCHSLEADRVLWFFLSNEILGKKNKKRFLYIEPHASIRDKLEQAHIHTDTVKRNTFTNKLLLTKKEKNTGGIYDVIIFSHQLQYIGNEDVVLAELKRLLRTGGTILLQTIVNPNMDRAYENIETAEDRDRLKSFYQPGIKSIYGINLSKQLTKAGFKVEVIDFAQQLGESAIEYYCLGSSYREIIYKCKKP